MALRGRYHPPASTRTTWNPETKNWPVVEDPFPTSHPVVLVVHVDLRGITEPRHHGKALSLKSSHHRLLILALLLLPSSGQGLGQAPLRAGNARKRAPQQKTTQKEQPLPKRTLIKVPPGEACQALAMRVVHLLCSFAQGPIAIPRQRFHSPNTPWDCHICRSIGVVPGGSMGRHIFHTQESQRGGV